MLMEKSLSSNKKYWTVRCPLANNHSRLNHYWSIFFIKKKHLTGKLWDVHWQISHWTNKRKQKVVNKSKSWTAIPTQFRVTRVLVFGIWFKSSSQKFSLKLIHWQISHWTKKRKQKVATNQSLELQLLRSFVKHKYWSLAFSLSHPVKSLH